MVTQVEKSIEPVVHMYTDGSCLKNPGVGGWAVLLRFQGKERILTGSEAFTTNNRMELTAVISGFSALKLPCRVIVYSDSQYVIKGMTQWIQGWIKRGWRTQQGAVQNRDLWEALQAASALHTIDWQWVRGHAGQAENEQVDFLAREAARLRAAQDAV